MGGNTRRFLGKDLLIMLMHKLHCKKLSKLKQDHQQTLHSFAQKITETAREAYSEADYATAIVTRQLRDIFINGLRCHRTSQLLIREQIVDLPTALNIAVRQDLLRQTYKLREVDKIDGEGRHVAMNRHNGH